MLRNGLKNAGIKAIIPRYTLRQNREELSGDGKTGLHQVLLPTVMQLKDTA